MMLVSTASMPTPDLVQEALVHLVDRNGLHAGPVEAAIYVLDPGFRERARRTQQHAVGRLLDDQFRPGRPLATPADLLGQHDLPLGGKLGLEGTVVGRL